MAEGDGLRETVHANTRYWRAGLTALGFELLPGEHPIVPVMPGDAQLAQDMAAQRDREGVFVDAALNAFALVGRAVGVLS